MLGCSDLYIVSSDGCHVIVSSTDLPLQPVTAVGKRESGEAHLAVHLGVELTDSGLDACRFAERS